MSSIHSYKAATGNYTNEYTFLSGTYKSGDACLPYFSVQMRIGDAINDLVLAGELVPDTTQPVKMAELFQRSVDRDRVEYEIVPYLEHQNDLKFFNSLTVVLLPVDGKRITDAYPKDVPDSPSVESPELKATNVGPIQFIGQDSSGEIEGWEFGELRWNRDRVKAVIVDGQHRFSALKSAVGAGKAKGLTESRIPVLLLVLDPRAGFKVGAPGESLPSVLGSCRQIFSDLNQHAKAVPVVRRMLLDDQDLVAASMRAIIDDDLHTGSDLSGVQLTKRIPLCVIDWQSGKAKVDTNEYLISLPTLYEAVSTSLGDATLPALDCQRAKSVFSGLKSRINLSEEDSKKITDAIDRADTEGLPYLMSAKHTLMIADDYATLRGRLVTEPLLKLTPYRELLTASIASDVLAGTYEAWAILEKSSRQSFLEQNDLADPSPTMNSNTKSKKEEYPLAFQVVFQRALLDSATQLFDARHSVADIVGQPSLADAIPDDFMVWWLKRAEDRIVPWLTPAGTTPSAPWLGTGYGASGKLIWSQAGRTGLTAVMALLLLLPDVDKFTESEAKKECKSWLSKAWKPAKTGAAELQLRRAYVGTWRDRIVAYLKDVARTNQKPFDAEKAKSEALVIAADLLHAGSGFGSANP